jgi:hypothetical protein
MKQENTAPSLWQTFLPVVQEINDYGGGASVFLFSRAVFEEIENGANDGDKTLADKKSSILDALAAGKWPSDPSALSAIFNTYHEALFYLVAKRRRVILESVPETRSSTPDFFCRATDENFEVKTLDYSGGSFAHKVMMNEGIDRKIEAEEKARASGIGTAISTITPHGNAQNSKEAIQKVIYQISNNIKSGQFSDKPTILVVALTRTAIRSREEELEPLRDDHRTGEKISGHLWTIAANPAFSDFIDVFDDSYKPKSLTLDSEGIFITHPFVQGIIFLCTEWSEIDNRDILDLATLDRAFKLLGVWNGNYIPHKDSSRTPIGVRESEFHKLCDKYIEFK